MWIPVGRTSTVMQVLLLLFLVISSFHHSASDSANPNILLIVADDLGWNDLSLTGNPTISTPNIDRLARQGSFFTQFLTAAPICTPSRAAMLTGRLPIRTGVYANLDYPLDDLFRVFYPSSVYCLPENEITIGDALKQKGTYSSAMVGKWHLGHNPEHNCLPGRGKQGFDFFYGLPYSHEEGYPGPFPEGLIFPPVPLLCDDMYVEQPFNMSDLTSRYTELTIELIQRFANGNTITKSGIGDDNRYGASGSDSYVNARIQDGHLDFSRSFFIHLAYENPHVPLFISDSYYDTHEPSRRGLYGDSVQEMDASIGVIMDTLGETGLIDSTIVIFLSDNGAWVNPNNGLTSREVKGMTSFDGGSNAPFFGGKGSTYEGGMRVPLIISVPPGIQGSTTSIEPQYIRAPVMAVDLFPTILDYANVKMPEDVSYDGVSLRTLIEGTANGDPHDCLYYWREKDLYAIRCGPLKAHFKTRSGFNSSDPGETHDPPLMYNVEWDAAEQFPLNPDDYRQELVQIKAAAAVHIMNIEKERPPSLYVPQNFTLMPCCPRAGYDTAASEQAAISKDWNNAVWEDCICSRPSFIVA